MSEENGTAEFVGCLDASKITASSGTAEDFIRKIRIEAKLEVLAELRELHHSETEQSGHIAGQYSCVECSRADVEGLSPVLFPCPTIQAITSSIQSVS